MTVTPIEVCTWSANQQNDLVHRQGMMEMIQIKDGGH
jgi:hypothetical protein